MSTIVSLASRACSIVTDAPIEVQKAIEIAWSPSSDQTLKTQAFDYLHTLRSSPSAAQICLSLFARQPYLDEVIRHVSLDLVNHAVQTERLDLQNLQQLRDMLFDYVKQHYGSLAPPTAQPDSRNIQNKIAQTLTYLFEYLYQSGWESFFGDLWELSENGSNFAGTTLYLRVLTSVHDEIADQMVNTTSSKKTKLYTELKDVIRARDVGRIAASWQEILSKKEEVQGNIVELCLKTISRWVSWTDISLVVNEASISQFFSIATQQIPHGTSEQATQFARDRDAAIGVFTEIIAKKMQPAEKIDLIQFMNLDGVVVQLISSPVLQDTSSPNYDTDMAETVAKLVNNAVSDIVKVIDTTTDDGTRIRAEQSLSQFVLHLLRFFADAYDEVCSTVIPCLTELLSLIRKISSAQSNLPEPYHNMIRPILDAVIAKMRYDDTSSWGEEGEETDEAEFQELRKRLRILQDIIAIVDERLYIETLGNVVTPVLTLMETKISNINWRDIDLAMLELYLLGELAQNNGGLYHKRKPSSIASEKITQLMPLMVRSDVASFPHPAIHLQYMENCVRQSDFLDQHPEYVEKVLEDFVRFTHSNHVKVRAKSHHYFLRLAQKLKSHLGRIAEGIIRALSDLLTINAEVPDDSNADDGSSNEDSQSSEALFNAQLQLFEAIGCIASAPSVPAEMQGSLAKSSLEPLSLAILENLPAAQQGNERAILQIHHLMMAIGTLARGFSDWQAGRPQLTVHAQVSEQFGKASETVLNALTVTNGSINIRSAARFAFSRMIGVLGQKALEELPRWVEGLLSTSTKDEIATFIKLMDQIIYGFKSQIFSFLNEFFTPLLQKVGAGLSEPVTGTDDEIQLGELRREYLNFFLVLLNNDLGPVLVSEKNQPILVDIIASIEHYAGDISNSTDAKLALAVLARMSTVWGGPDIANPTSNPANPAPSVPGFDQFMLTRFSALTWRVVSAANFNPKEPNANRVLSEVAILQQAILAKTGQTYLKWLREVDLQNLGVQGQAVDDYLHALVTKDGKGFKTFLVTFLQRGA